QVETDQRIPGAHLRALTRMRLEPFPSECHGVDADMQQDLATGCGPQRDCMPRGGQHQYLAVARCEQRAGSRVDRHAIAQHAICEHLVGCLGERAAPAGERRYECECTPSAHGASWIQSSAHMGSSVRCVNRKHNACVPARCGSATCGNTVTASLPAAGARGSSATGSLSQLSVCTSSSPSAL